MPRLLRIAWTWLVFHGAAFGTLASVALLAVLCGGVLTIVVLPAGLVALVAWRRPADSTRSRLRAVGLGTAAGLVLGAVGFVEPIVRIRMLTFATVPMLVGSMWLVWYPGHDHATPVVTTRHLPSWRLGTLACTAILYAAWCVVPIAFVGVGMRRLATLLGMGG